MFYLRRISIWTIDCLGQSPKLHCCYRICPVRNVIVHYLEPHYLFVILGDFKC